MVNQTTLGKESYDLREDFKRWKDEGDREFEKLLNAKKAVLKRNGGFFSRLFRFGAENIEKTIDKELLDMNFDEYEKSLFYDCKSGVSSDNEGPSENVPAKKQGKDVIRKRKTVINTPLNTRRLPRIITPKVTCGTEVQARVLEPDEIAFSVTGSPVVVGQDGAVDDEARQIADLLEMNEEDFTPETRKVVHGLRTVMRKLRNS